MGTVLVWLGSGFAFAVGVSCGAFLMANLTTKRSISDGQMLQIHNKSLELQADCVQAHRDIADEINCLRLAMEGKGAKQ